MSSGDPLSAMIVDDEEPARAMLRKLLAREPDLRVIAEADNGPEAVRLIESHRPAVVFLDVQMPGMSGIDVASRVMTRYSPLIVFVTAYDRYAVKAFELSASDYLLKPFDAARLRSTVERVLSRGRSE